MLTAAFPSTCGECGERIEVGETIRRSPSFGWIHGQCPDLPDQPRAHRQRRPAEVCPVCFLEKPCAC